jgi:PAS domain S-box-containing protein
MKTTNLVSGSILIVDDMLDNLKLLTALLTERGYVVRTAKNGHEAMASIQSSIPDLVLLDIKLPDIDGYEVCTRLKSDKQTQDIPVIFLSALNEPDNIIQGFETGGVDYVTKPFKIPELLARVQTHIDMRQMQLRIQQQSLDLQLANQKLLAEINKRLSSEEALKVQNTLLTALINSPNDIIIFSLDKNYCYTTFNERHRAEMKTVWNVDIKIGMNLLDCMPIPELKDYAKQSIDKAFQGKVFSEIQYQPGAEIYYEFHWNPIYLNQEIIGVTSFIRDITERTQAEYQMKGAIEALRLRESYLSAIIENQPGLLWMKDIGGKFLAVNTKFSNSCGFDNPELLVGKTDFDIWPHELAAGYVADDEKVMKSGKPFIVEEYISDKGDIRWFETFKAPIIDKHGIVIGTTGYSRNITERKETELQLKEKNNEIKARNEEYLQLNEELRQINDEMLVAKEKAEESDRLKTSFLQNMSHEIRTPMNAIMGFAKLLVQNYNNKPKLEQFSEIINLRCNDLLEIINDILDIAKIESGQLPVNNEECNLNELFLELDTFFKEHQKRIGKQHIRFNLQMLCNPSEISIVTDKVKLKQIFLNLIGNAFKFTDQGKIQGGCKYDANNNLIFYVSDTGIGIPSDKHEAIFERFTQLNDEKKQPYGGTGLGLSIVKGLVGLLGGKIWIESELEKGTTFYFSFPYKVSKSVNREPVLKGEKHTYHFSGKTILVVEDDIYNATYIKEILSDTDINIILTKYGNEAVQFAISRLPDLILMDIRLPDMDGYEAIRQIKQQKPGLRIIAQTAYAAHEDKQKAFDAGCNDYISKPIKRELLLAMIHAQLNPTPKS